MYFIYLCVSYTEKWAIYVVKVTCFHCVLTVIIIIQNLSECEMNCEVYYLQQLLAISDCIRHPKRSEQNHLTSEEQTSLF